MNEMRNDKAECQCCKKMMVPRVVMERSIYVDGVQVGGEKPLKSICPFCLSEEWNGMPRKSGLARLRRDAILGLRAISLELTIIGGIALFFAVMAIYRFVFVGFN
ncbi:hypothetical protein GCM10009086_55410 [Pseudomonas rhodesiae]|nr:hypothetical protein QV12_01705 [Pseudomonas putida]OHC26028.1 MAG: hypothetical protein A3J25_03065 [Pseudomonadales bacterium RIFCSPLOWO2_02_FULL_63_210]QCO95515.1 Hypothetical protein [Pseudomonas aeruginosa]